MRSQVRCSLRCAPVTTPDVDAAARFLAANARVLDRRRFERLFSGGDARPVRDAVAAFRNSDGGFGHALEPDGRTPASQPAAVAMALGTLDESEAWDEELRSGETGIDGERCDVVFAELEEIPADDGPGLWKQPIHAQLAR
jgi:hypothetical protein